MLAERRRLGQDGLDEVWEGEYHMVPGPHGRHGRADMATHDALRPHAEAAGLMATSTFNLGDEHDYRVPDQGYHRGGVDRLWFPTAALVVEVLSPGDETFAKLGFYARHGVDEILVVDPDTHDLQWFALTGRDYQRVEHSTVLAVAVAAVAASMTW